jgi:hypothetical protein
MEYDRIEPDSTARILRFERPGARRLSRRRHPVAIPPSQPEPPLPDIARYENPSGEADDYRHRQWTNAAAFLICALLIVGGVWIAQKIAELRRDQDCVLAGRRNCSPIVIMGNTGR